MRRLMISALALSFSLSAQPAAAQNMEIYERLAAAMERAQAQAVHPGDDALTCEQLETEAVAVSQDPTIQAMAVQSGAYSQERMDEINRASSAMRRQAGLAMFTGIAGSLASAFIPGAGMVTGLAQRAQSAAMQRQAQQSMAQSMQMVEQMLPAMPQMMRGQRVYELAQAKQCAFMQQATAQGQTP